RRKASAGYSVPAWVITLGGTRRGMCGGTAGCAIEPGTPEAPAAGDGPAPPVSLPAPPPAPGAAPAALSAPFRAVSLPAPPGPPAGGEASCARPARRGRPGS